MRAGIGVLFLLWTCVVSAGEPDSSPQSDVEAQIAALDDQLDELRDAGEIERALAVARELLALRAKHEPEGSWRTVSRRCTVDALEMHLSLPPDARAKLDEATALWDERDAFRKDGEYLDAAGVTARILEIERTVGTRETQRLFEALVEHAVDLDDAGKPLESLPLAEESLAVAERVFGENHPNVSRALNLLATLYLAQSRMDDAERYLLRSLAIRRHARGPQHPRVATVLNNLGAFEFRRRNLDRSLAYFEEALAVRQAQPEPDERAILTTLSNIAALQNQLGKFAAAEASLIQIAERQRKTLGDRHPDVARTLSNLATIRTTRRDLEGAEAALDEAYDICLERLGPNHPFTARLLDLLSQTMRARGEFAAMEPILRRSLAIAIERLGNDHEDTAGTRFKLGSSLLLQSRYRESLEEFREVHRVFLELLGPEDPKTLLAYRQVGLALQSLHEFEAARVIFTELIAHHEARGEAGREDLQVLLHDLGSLEKRATHYDVARSYYDRSLAIRRELGLEANEEHLRMLLNLGNLEHEAGNYVEAKLVLQSALELAGKLYPRDHPETATILSHLGDTHAALGDVLEAKQLLLEAIAIFEGRLGSDHSLLDVAYSRLTAVLGRQGRFDQLESLIRGRLARLEARIGPSADDTLINRVNLGRTLYLLDRPREAVPLYHQVIASLESQETLPPRELGILATAHDELAAALDKMGDIDGSIAAYLKGIELHEARGNTNSSSLAARKADLARTYLRRGQPERARSLLESASAILENPDASYVDPELTRAQVGVIRALLLEEEGNWEEVETTLRDCVATFESKRAIIRGTLLELDRFEQLSGLYDATAFWAAALAHQGRAAEAFEALERGRTRAVLDLLSREADADDRGEESAELSRARRAAETARQQLVEAESRLADLLQRDDLDPEVRRDQVEIHQRRVGELRIAYDGVREREADALRRLVPGAEPRSIEELRAGLRQGEVYLAFSSSETRWIALLVPAEGQGTPRSFELTSDRRATAELARDLLQLQKALASASPEAEPLGATVGRRLFPAELRDALAGTQRVILLTDDPLAPVPVEPLAWGDALWVEQSFETVRAGSASLFLDRRRRLEERRELREPDAPVRVVTVGNPTFVVPARAEGNADELGTPDSAPTPPPEGVLLESVTDGSLSDEIGLRPGDVIVSYGNRPTPDVEALSTAWKALNESEPPAEIPIEYWRDGSIRKATGRPGRLGVQPSRLSPDIGVAIVRARVRSSSSAVHAASALDQVRLYGDRLTPLEGTQREVDRITELAQARGFRALQLDRSEATVPNFRDAVTGSRFVHLATHGLLGSTERPADASLAFATPATPTSDDNGFLTLERMLHDWAGRLDESELVVLSACDSSRASDWRRRASSLITGIFYAGAPTVLASQWKVDDDATSLLMGRFYENLWGGYDGARTAGSRTFEPAEAMSKPLALQEAKQWLRSASSNEIRAALGITDDAAWNEFVGRLRGRPRVAESSAPSRVTGDRPYAHPFYWAAFTLIGSGD